MRWFLARALLTVGGCGESAEGQGTTIVTIAFPGPEIHIVNAQLRGTGSSCHVDRRFRRASGIGGQRQSTA